MLRVVSAFAIATFLLSKNALLSQENAGNTKWLGDEISVKGSTPKLPTRSVFTTDDDFNAEMTEVALSLRLSMVQKFVAIERLAASG